MNTPSVRSCLGVLFRALLGTALFGLAVLQGADASRLRFDVPAGDAPQTLKQFAQQAKREILFPVQPVGGVKTNAVVGELTVGEALAVLLRDTELSAVEDAVSGAIVVKRDNAANGQGRRGEAAEKRAESGKETISLPEFRVSTNLDKGYRAGNSVSATRIETPIKDLPFAVSAFTEQFISDVGAHELKDILRFSSSVTGNSREFGPGNNRNTDFTVRGFLARPQRNGFGGTGYIDIATVERVEVVKGPSTLLYGQTAPGGAINYITKRPGEKQAVSVTAQAGSWDYYRAQIDANVPLIAGKVLFRINTSFENDWEYILNHTAKTQVIAPVLTWLIDDQTSVTLDFQWMNRRDAAQTFYRPSIQVPLTNRTLYPGANGGQRFPVAFFGPQIEIGNPRFNVSDPNDYRLRDFDTFNFELNRKLGDRWRARALFSYDRGAIETRQHGRGDVDMIIPAADLAGLSNNPAIYLRELLNIATLARYGATTTMTRRLQFAQDKNWDRAYQVEASGKYELPSLTWKPLVGYAYNRFQNYNFVNTLNTSLTWKIMDPSTWQESNVPNNLIPASAPTRGAGYNHGAYVVNQITAVDDRLQALGGLRWSKSFADATPAAPSFELTRTTPQVGVGFKLQRDLMVYGSYSESFTANNRLLRLRSAQATIPAKPNEGRGYEIGLKSDLLDGRVSATLAAFSIEESNSIIVRTEIQPNGTTFASDLQDGNVVRNRGIELEGVWSPTDNLQIFASASLHDPRWKSAGPGLEYIANTQPQGTAKRLASVWGRYSFDRGTLKGVWIAGGLNHTNHKAQNSNNPYVIFPTTTVFDAVVGYDWRLQGRPMSASLTWKNVGDVDDTLSLQAPRQPSRVFASVTARF